jgi:hypothetical protein
MKSVQSRGLQCFRRVEAWFAEHPGVVPAAGSSAGALAGQVTALQQVVDRMREAGRVGATRVVVAAHSPSEGRGRTTEARRRHV